MTTHQQLSNTSDDEFVKRQTIRYGLRFNERFWDFFAKEVEARLPSHSVIVDLACGPGLYLRDVSRRHPDAVLHGYDITPAMIEAAGKLDYAGEKPVLAVQDVAKTPLPLEDSSVDLLSISAAMHLFEGPFAFLAEVRRVLKPQGLFLAFEWVRVPMRQYMHERQTEPTESSEEPWVRSLKLFAAHNKYTVDDWRWVLDEGGMEIIAETDKPHQRGRVFLTRPRTS